MIMADLLIEGMMDTFDYMSKSFGMSMQTALRGIWRYAIISIREIRK
jgi:hypothetical protein